MRDLIIGTAGHIDHGKTALVRALTGIDTDRLEEEKRRGITIDLGFAHMQIGGYRLGFIDVPGHERFVKNMLAGIGGIQFLLLVVGADESIMPQTLEHFQICDLLQIPAGIIVITKKNQVEPDLLDLVRDEVAELVKGSRLENAPILSVDSPTGEGIPELREEIGSQIERLDRERWLVPSVQRVFRLPIDRVFTVKGFGTVVTGTLQGGEINQDDSITVYPDKQTGKIRGIQIFGEQTSRAEAGQRTALNLIGLDKEALGRGMTLGAPGTLNASSRFTVKTRLLETAPGPLGQRDPIRFHHGSGEMIGRVHLLDRAELNQGESAIVQFHLEEPAVCFPGDRFILRRYSPLTTIGGGMVLDIHPPRVARKDLPEHLVELSSIDSCLDSDPPSYDSLVKYLVTREGTVGSDLRSLVMLTGLQESALLQILKNLKSVLLVPTDPPLAVSRKSIAALCDSIRGHLKDYHSLKPLAVGVPREEIKKRFLPGSSGIYFQFLLDIWAADRVLSIQGKHIALYGSEIRLNPVQEEIRAKVLRTVAGSALNAPTLAEITSKVSHPPEEVREVFYYLLEAGEILKVSGEMVLAPMHLERLKERLHRAFPQGTLFTVPEFKEIFSLSRKYAIPLLEMLDREKVTRRMGDGRMVV